MPLIKGLFVVVVVQVAFRRHLHALERRPWTAGEIRAALARFPLMTAKVTAAIHWEALKLRLKGLPVQPFPDEDVSYDTAH